MDMYDVTKSKINPMTRVDMITLTVEKTMMGARCSFKSFKFTWTAPAKSRKFSMAPISTSVKSNSEINFEKFKKVFGNILPETTSKIEETMAIIMIPIVGGSFKNRMLI